MFETVAQHYDVPLKGIMRYVVPEFTKHSIHTKFKGGLKDRHGNPLGNWRKKRLIVDICYLTILHGGKPPFIFDRSIPPSAFAKSITRGFKLSSGVLNETKRMMSKPVSVDFSSEREMKGGDFKVIGEFYSKEIEEMVNSFEGIESKRADEIKKCKKKKNIVKLEAELSKLSSYKRITIDCVKEEFKVYEDFGKSFPPLSKELDKRVLNDLPLKEEVESYASKLLKVCPTINGKSVGEVVSSIIKKSSASAERVRRSDKMDQLSSIIKAERKEVLSLIDDEKNIFKTLNSRKKKAYSDLIMKEIEESKSRSYQFRNKFKVLEEMSQTKLPFIPEERLSPEEEGFIYFIVKNEKKYKTKKREESMLSTGLIKVKEGVLNKTTLIMEGPLEDEKAESMRSSIALRRSKFYKKTNKKIEKKMAKRTSSRNDFLKNLGNEGFKNYKSCSKIIESNRECRRRSQNRKKIIAMRSLKGVCNLLRRRISFDLIEFENGSSEDESAMDIFTRMLNKGVSRCENKIFQLLDE